MTKRKRAKVIPQHLNISALSPEEIDNANRVLETLILNPPLLQTANLKPIRENLYNLLKSLCMSNSAKLFTASQLTSIILEKLSEKEWSEALTALYAMIELKKVPKLGSFQRIVARIDWNDTMIAKRLLSAAIIASMQADIGGILASDVFWNEWCNCDKQISKPIPSDMLRFEALLNEEDINVKHITIWRDVNDNILFQNAPSSKIMHSKLDFIDGGFCLSSVFDAIECASLIQIAENIGFVDASGYATTPETANLERGASGLVWCMEPNTTTFIFHRIKEYLPQMFGRNAIGINSRFRFYKYMPGAVYKPHIDGAWPGSGYSEEGVYLHDAFSDRLSRLTLIIYLNDGHEFEGGETRFFGIQHGELVTRRVKPKAGCCLLFPHGDAHAGIVHEGCPVLKGIKYIIRTDVLYPTK